MRTVSQNTIFFYCLIMLLFTSCGEEDRNPVPEIDSLESLKAMFDQGMITQVDFKTLKQDNILFDEIIAMELIDDDEVAQFPYLKLSSLSEEGEEHLLRLTLDQSVTGSITEDMMFAPWVKTLTYLNGKENNKFTPYAVIFESGITSSGLNIWSDVLQIYFYKK